MERYELLNKILLPVDYGIGAGLKVVKALKLYEPLQDATAHFLRAVLNFNFRLMNQLEVIGKENIPMDKGAIVAANHQSWLDAQVLGASLPRVPRFIAKQMLYDFSILRHILELARSLPVSRGEPTPEQIQAQVDALKSGELVVIFPEGTIPGEENIGRDKLEKNTGLLQGKTGVVRLAIMAGVPIIPVGISGTGQAFPPEMYPRLEMFPLPKPVPITIKIGKPMYFENCGINPEDLMKGERSPEIKKRLRELTDQVMMEISKLVDHSRCFIPIEVPMKDPITSPEELNYTPKREEKSKYGFLCIHGFTSHISTVSGLVPFIRKYDIPYRFPVLRGHMTKPEDLIGVTDRDWYEDAEKSLKDLAKYAEKVIVLGFSMGGLVAIELGIKYPDLISNVILVAAALRYANPLAMLTPLMAKVFKFWPGPVNEAYNKKELARASLNYKKFPTDSFVSLYNYSSKIEKQLPEFTRPVLILQSKKDRVIAPKSAEIIYTNISSLDKKIIWFEESGHEMMQDLEKEAVFATIDEYIGKIVQ